MILFRSGVGGRVTGRRVWPWTRGMNDVSVADCACLIECGHDRFPHLDVAICRC